MTETIATQDEHAQEIAPATTGLDQVVKKAKRVYRSFTSPTKERAPDAARAESKARARSPDERAGPHGETQRRIAHDAWLRGLTELQRRAYEAHQQGRLRVNDCGMRDVLRAAMSLHPNREDAAHVLRSLRAPLGQADDLQRVEGTPALDVGLDATPAFTSELARQRSDGERANETIFEHAFERIGSLSSEVSVARVRNEESYKALNLPELPKDSPRRKLLADPPKREQDARVMERGRHHLGRVDDRIGIIRENILDDPLWIAADYLDRTTKLEKIDQHVREDARVKEARSTYTKAEDRVRKAARALDNFEPRTVWKRALDVTRGITKNDDELHRELHANMKEASLGLNQAKRVLDGAEREARYAAQELNAQAREIQREACARRDELEQPLREALVDRHIAECALMGERAPHHLRDARDLGSLTYLGERQIHGFAYHEFGSFGGPSYLADVTELRSTLDPLKLEYGDRVLLRTDERGARHLEVEERVDPSRSPGLGKERQVITRDRGDAADRGR